MNTVLKFLGLTLLGTVLLSTQSSANRVRNDMPFICKYEAKRNFGVSQSASQTLPVERTRNGFIVYGQSPRNTNRALFYECRFDRRGEYRSIRKTSDKRYGMGHGHGNSVPKVARRICKGEASARWRMRPHDIRITNTKRLGRNDNMVYLAGRNYRGKCEVSNSGHIYLFQTRFSNGAGSAVAPREARRACKRRASSRWGVSPSSIRVVRDRRLGRDDYNVKLAFRNDRAECEVSGRGRIYFFSEY